MRPAGDSAEQREAEGFIIAALSRDLGVALEPQSFVDAQGTRVTVDGVATTPAVLVEAWAHQGPPKSAQKAKVMKDALKLLWLDRARFEGRARKVLALSDPAAAEAFLGHSWMAAVLRDFHIEVHVVELPGTLWEQLRRAQARQFR